MESPDLFDPYKGNLLTAGLGPILSRDVLMGRLLELPTRPKKWAGVDRHLRMHFLTQLRDFHMPQLEELRLAETIDLILRGSYRHRDPAHVSTFGILSGEVLRRRRASSGALAAAVEGPSGTGKTQAIQRCLGLYPQQVIEHEKFPHLLGEHRQVVWMSIDVPASGKAEDLARVLMRGWDVVNGTSRFSSYLDRDRFRNPMAALDEWRQVAATHFLGVLHLDEVQNFFKLPTLEQRRKRKSKVERFDLSIVEDQCLKWILTLLNTWGIPVIFSGTSDGIGALTRRMSNMQRFGTGGYHSFSVFETAGEDSPFASFFEELSKYQAVAKPIPKSKELAELVLALSGGIPRVIVALWIAANRIALEKDRDELQLSDIKEAARTFLGPLAPVVAAIRNRDPEALSAYEDLVSSDPTLWERFWHNVRSHA